METVEILKELKKTHIECMVAFEKAIKLSVKVSELINELKLDD